MLTAMKVPRDNPAHLQQSNRLGSRFGTGTTNARIGAGMGLSPHLVIELFLREILCSKNPTNHLPIDEKPEPS